MRSWQKLRATQPELFADGSIRVWSQPAAVVDSVIYRWQLETEAEEHRQAVQLVDMFAAAWTEESMHAAALLQRAQTGIAAGCTGLTQVTDTGFGQPKAALARWQEELKQRMREKARQQKVHCTYRTGPQDILQAARQMHARMVEINETDSAAGRLVPLSARQSGPAPGLRQPVLVPELSGRQRQARQPVLARQVSLGGGRQSSSIFG